jgi:hypothetical protein
MIERSPAHLLKDILPPDVIYVISSYVPKYYKKKKLDVSPSAQRELKRLQFANLKGKNDMYLRDLDDFCLD